MAQRRPVRKTPRTAFRAAPEPPGRPWRARPRPPSGAPRDGTTVTVRCPAGYGTTATVRRPVRYGTTVTGQRPAFTSRTATEPMMRCPACSEAPTTTASALSSSAAFTRPL